MNSGNDKEQLTKWLQKPDPCEDQNEQHDAMMERIVAALKEIYDPEIPVNIYDLGLIYDVRIEPDGVVAVQMTLTTPGCPVAETFPGTVQSEVSAVEGVSAARVDLVWDPPWTPDNLSDAARLELGML